MADAATGGPDAGRWGRIHTVGGLAILALAAFQLTAFSLLDRRPPNDHDLFYTRQVMDYLFSYGLARWPQRLEQLWNLASSRVGGHGQLPQAWLLALTHVTGFDRLPFRLSNLPWLLLMVGGMVGAGRAAGRPRSGLLAGLIAASLPVAVSMSRKWFPHIHAAALVPAAWALGFTILRRRGDAPFWLWSAFGAVLGLRAWVHPIALPDGALTFVLVSLAALVGSDRRLKTLGGIVLGAATGLLVASPQFAAMLPQSSEGEAYSRHLERYTRKELWRNGGWPLIRKDIRTAVELMARHHWTVAMMATVAAPAALALLPALWKKGRTPLLLLILVVAAQLPIFFFVVSNHAFPSDWLHLHLELVLLAVLALDRVLGDRAARVHAFAVAVAAAWVLGVPAAASFGTLDPLVDALKMPPHVAPFARSDHGRTWKTHHLIVRKTHVAEQLRDVVFSYGDDARWSAFKPQAAVGQLELEWSGDDPCAPSAGSWRVEFGNRDGWPYLFEFQAAGVGLNLEQSVEPRILAARVWAPRCEGRHPLPATSDSAVAAAQELYPGSKITAVQDLPELATGNHEPMQNPTQGYASVVLLIEQPSGKL